MLPPSLEALFLAERPATASPQAGARPPDPPSGASAPTGGSEGFEVPFGAHGQSRWSPIWLGRLPAQGGSAGSAEGCPIQHSHVFIPAASHPTGALRMGSRPEERRNQLVSVYILGLFGDRFQVVIVRKGVPGSCPLGISRHRNLLGRLRSGGSGPFRRLPGPLCRSVRGRAGAAAGFRVSGVGVSGWRWRALRWRGPGRRRSRAPRRRRRRCGCRGGRGCCGTS